MGVVAISAKGGERKWLKYSLPFAIERFNIF
jgi:hypothetical protein